MHSPATTLDAIRAASNGDVHTPMSYDATASSHSPTTSEGAVVEQPQRATAGPDDRSGDSGRDRHANTAQPRSGINTAKRGMSAWRHYATFNRERGMSTAEYAVGTIAACAFAALLFKVVSSTEVQEMLTSLIDRALNTAKK